MSGLDSIAPRCEVCGEASVGEYPDGTGSLMCAVHLKEFKYRDALEAELAQVVGSWAEGHKLTTAETSQTLQAIGGDVDSRARAEANARTPRPERTDYFIECEAQHPALVLAYFHLLRNEAQLAGFPDVWVKDIHLKIEVSGDETRLDELRERVDALWLGAWVSSSDTLPKRV